MVFKKKKHPVQIANEEIPKVTAPWDEGEFYDDTERVVNRTFETGATRDTDSGKYEYGGFFSPEVLKRRAAYMHQHRFLPDETLRASDNWKKGIPMDVYFESFMRHMVEIWQMHSEAKAGDSICPAKLMEDAICAAMFNLEGYLFEFMKADF